MRKVRIEIDPSAEEEVIIRCPALTPELLRLQQIAEGGSRAEADLTLPLTLDDTEYFIPARNLLFFETAGSRTAAHTRENMYYTDLKLYELEELLPDSFVRASKSCILNVKAVASLRRGLTGIAEVAFARSEKRVFVSRMYYHPFREKLLGSGLARGKENP